MAIVLANSETFAESDVHDLLYQIQLIRRDVKIEEGDESCADGMDTVRVNRKVLRILGYVHARSEQAAVERYMTTQVTSLELRHIRQAFVWPSSIVFSAVSPIEKWVAASYEDEREYQRIMNNWAPDEACWSTNDPWDDL